MRAEYLSRQARIGLLIACACTGAAGCSRVSVPGGFLQAADEQQRDPYGAWIEVQPAAIDSAAARAHDRRAARAKGLPPVRGEFLAAGDSIFVLTADGLVGIDAATVLRADVVAFDSHSRAVAAWMAAGALSSLSHGVIGVVSIPGWLLIGGIAATAQYEAAAFHYPADAWGELRRFARFPQGLPPAVDRRALRIKPYVAPKPAVIKKL